MTQVCSSVYSEGQGRRIAGSRSDSAIEWDQSLGNLWGPFSKTKGWRDRTQLRHLFPMRRALGSIPSTQQNEAELKSSQWLQLNPIVFNGCMSFDQCAHSTMWILVGRGRASVWPKSFMYACMCKTNQCTICSVVLVHITLDIPLPTNTHLNSFVLLESCVFMLFSENNAIWNIGKG